MSSVVVTGSAAQQVQPDRAVIGLGLTVVARDAASALDQVSERSATLRERLTGLGFGPDDWVTDGVTVAEEWEYKRDQNTLVGHRASTAVTVTVEQLDRLAPLIRLAVGDAGAQVRDLLWEVDRDHPVRTELLGRAARDARRRAEAYAAALGLQLGAVELVSEAPIAAAPGPAPYADMMPMARAMKAQATPDLAVSGGRIELSAEVHVRFAILPSGG
ncbi:MAG: SIMPL domain-containing protein [Acidimicrobiales bacterium]